MIKSCKFLFIIDSFNTGGAQRQLANLAIGLTNRGYKLDIFCYSQGDLLAQPLLDAGIHIFWHKKKSRFSTDVIFELSKLIKQKKYDLLLSFLTTPNFYSIVSGKLVNRKPVIVSERRSDLPQGATRMDRVVRQFYRFVDYVITNSFYQRRELAKNYPWMEKKLATIYNGYDLDLFFPSEELQSSQNLRILSIAHVSPHKNGLCLIEALKILANKYQLFPIVDWIGQLIVDPSNTDYLDEMKRKIDEYKLNNQWNWCSQRTDIVFQLNNHDVLVHPSYGEGLPNVVCEAMSCGKPVILSDHLDHRNLVKNGENGYLFEYENPHDLAERIYGFYKLPIEDRKMMGIKGRKFAEENLSLEQFVDKYEHLFLRVLKE